MAASDDDPFAVPTALQEHTEKEPSVLAKLLVIFASLIAVPVAFFSTCFGTGFILIGQSLSLNNSSSLSGESVIFIAVVVGLFSAVVVGIVMRRFYVRLSAPRNPHQPPISTEQAFDK